MFDRYTGLVIAAIALIFAGLFHVIIMRPQQRSVFVAFCWDVLVFLICLVGISIIYYSALPLMVVG
ncbi:hypothetical protein NQF86_06095 [Bombella sp. TMW 2.2543]|uniref:Uncharacterized protein n=1 Tax=Bombella pluederhausensis TaxID=2967336 RepID=A0ABT3WGL2_9PROT|nr:hypothetical protein [Bombella pluederhausensis]MCX5618235.1 hypothetical protein [Bombella pluederhausensis]